MFEFTQKLSETECAFPGDNDPVIVLCRKNTVVCHESGSKRLPYWSEVRKFAGKNESLIRVGKLDGRCCFAFECETLQISDGILELWQIRQFLHEFSEAASSALCRARELLHWRMQHRFCGRCRWGLQASERDSGLICPACGSVYYPQLAPAVIVGITRNEGRELLLAHNRNFAGNVYSLIAGFVEAGESLEAAVAREIREECGIEVKNLQYVTSQSWPFPNSLMLAFCAEYACGTARADGVELTDLGWFTSENHPELPAHGSVARAVIDRIFSRSVDDAH